LLENSGGDGDDTADADAGSDSESGSESGLSVSPAALAVSTAASVLDRAGVGPADVYSGAQRLGLDGVLQAIVPEEAKGGATEHVDWPASKAYCRARNEFGVRVNLAGREPTGIVPESEYEAVRSEVIAALETLRTPDGRPAFEWVSRREEVYDGPYIEDACDVLFVPTDMDHAVETQLVGRQFVGAEGYDHKPYGVFLASGPAFESVDLDTLSLTDVAPIVMASLDQPVPARMTGAIPDGLLGTPTVVEPYDDLTIDTGEDGTTDDRIEDRLSDLGYL
jgi:hypothetical protein